MIYEFPEPRDPVRQGDIFVDLPRMDLSLQKVPVYRESESALEEAPWVEVVNARKDPVSVVVAMRPVPAIVITQDCDALRSRLITLCEIREFNSVEGKAKNGPTTPGKWVKLITQQARMNQKWFYLPADSRMGFTDKMGVDFQVTLSVRREDLGAFISLRKGRLNPMADEHFRERIAEYFRRYPYDEWYPLDKAELAAYQASYPDAKPFSWQK